MTDHEQFNGFPARPNLQGYVPIPNVFFDQVLPNINNMSELKILLAVFRKTYGWVKEIDQMTGQPIYKLEDEISYTQFEKLTGLSSTSIATGLSRAQSNGYLEKVQQGDYSGVTSSYRIVTADGSKPRPPKPKPKPPQTPPQQQIKTPPPVVRLDLGDEDIQVPKQIKGTTLADITGGLVNGKPAPPKSEKDNLIDEIFGTLPAKSVEPKVKESTPHQQFISNWYRCYYSTMNLTYGNLTGKEHGHIKSMLKDYDLPVILKAMEYYFQNFKNLEGVPSDPPTITVFYSWRKKIIPFSQGIVTPTNNKPSRNAREFESNKWEGDDFFDN